MSADFQPCCNMCWHVADTSNYAFWYLKYAFSCRQKSHKHGYDKVLKNEMAWKNWEEWRKVEMDWDNMRLMRRIRFEKNWDGLRQIETDWDGLRTFEWGQIVGGNSLSSYLVILQVLFNTSMWCIQDFIFCFNVLIYLYSLMFYCLILISWTHGKCI